MPTEAPSILARVNSVTGRNQRVFHENHESVPLVIYSNELIYLLGHLDENPIDPTDAHALYKHLRRLNPDFDHSKIYERLPELKHVKMVNEKMIQEKRDAKEMARKYLGMHLVTYNGSGVTCIYRVAAYDHKGGYIRIAYVSDGLGLDPATDLKRAERKRRSIRCTAVMIKDLMKITKNCYGPIWEKHNMGWNDEVA